MEQNHTYALRTYYESKSKFFYVSAFELGYNYFNIIINIIVL